VRVIGPPSDPIPATSVPGAAVAAVIVAAAVLACTEPTAGPRSERSAVSTTVPGSKSGHSPAASPPAAVVIAEQSRLGTVRGVAATATPGVFTGHCLPSRMAEIITRFVGGIATDRGQTVGLVGDSFKWYSMSENETGRHVAVHSRRDLADLLAARAAHHERQRVVALLLKPGGHLEVVGVRVADDVTLGGRERVHVTSGKGAIDCQSGTVVVLSLATYGGLEDLTAPGAITAGLDAAELPAVANPVIDSLRSTNAPT
jgi:hypothetical protein